MHANTKLSTKEVVKRFKVGDIVTSEYHENDYSVKRIITKIEIDPDTGTGIRIWASDGGKCDCCGRILSKPINGADGAWFLPA